MNDMTPNELVTIEPQNALTIFTTANAIDPLLERVRMEIDGFHADVSTDKGRKAIASMAYKVAKAKTYLDDAGKALADQQKEIPKKIDACRKRIRDTLDQWKDEVRAPLTEWEAAEKNRVAGHKANIELLSSLWQVEGLDAATIKRRLAQAEGFAIDESCEEFLKEYAAEKDAAIASLRKSLAAREKYEAEQAVYANLRQAEQVRIQQERDAQIAREATEKAQREAEEKARFEAERVQREKVESEQREAKLKHEAEQALIREQQLKEQAEQQARQAEIDKALAIERAEQAAKQAEHNKQLAIQAERERIEREVREKEEAERKEQERREADKAHKKQVCDAILAELAKINIDEKTGQDLIKAIYNNQIPNIKITF